MIQLCRQTQLNSWILALPEDKYESPLPRYPETMEKQVFAVGRRKQREGFKTWILIMSFLIQESDHLTLVYFIFENQTLR